MRRFSNSNPSPPLSHSLLSDSRSSIYWRVALSKSTANAVSIESGEDFTSDERDPAR